jgi:hypothetical protein
MRLMRKHWKRLLFATAMVVFWPVLAVALLWWDSLPKPGAKVSIGYLTTVRQGGSNVVMFAVTNQSDFPVGCVVHFLTADKTNGNWVPSFLSTPPLTIWPGPIHQIPRQTNAVISVGVLSSNKWKVHIMGSDSRPTLLAKARGWFAWKLRDLNYSWSWKLQGIITARKAQVNATGPEMLGDAPAP